MQKPLVNLWNDFVWWLSHPGPDTEWTTVNHDRRGWVTMTDGAKARPDFYMTRVHNRVVENRRATPEEVAEYNESGEDLMRRYT